jgi:hypothetical protein
MHAKLNSTCTADESIKVKSGVDDEGDLYLFIYLFIYLAGIKWQKYKNRNLRKLEKTPLS